MSAETPLVLCLDDLDLSNHADQQIFKYLVRALLLDPAEHQFGIIGIFDSNSPNAASLLNLNREMQHNQLIDVRLKPFSSPDSARDFLAGIFSDRPVASSFAEKLLTLSGGNPRYIEEFLKSYIAEIDSFASLRFDDKAAKALRAPDSIAELVDENLQRIPLEIRRSLELLSCFFTDLVPFENAKTALASAPDCASLEQTISYCLRFGILSATRSDEQPTVSFPKKITQEILYSSLTPQRRQAAHSIIASSFKKQSSLTDALAIEEARQLLQARTGKNQHRRIEQAIDLCEQRGQLELALTMSQQLVDTQIDRKQKLNSYFRIARLSSTIGNIKQSRLALDGIAKIDAKNVEAVLVHAELDQKTGQFAQLRERCERLLEKKLGAIQRHRIVNLYSEGLVLTGHYQQAIDQLRPYVHSSKKSDPQAQARSHNTNGLAYYYLGAFDQANQSFRTALKLTTAHRATNEHISALYRLGMCEYNQGQFERAHELYEEAKKQAIAANDLKQLCSIELNFGTLNQHLSRLSEALENYRNGLRTSTQMEDQTNKTISHFNLATLLTFLGETNQAHSHARQALEISTQFEQTYFAAFSELLLGSIESLLGNTADGRLYLVRSVKNLRRVGSRRDIAIGIIELAKNHALRSSLKKTTYYVNCLLKNYGDVLDAKSHLDALLILSRASRQTSDEVINNLQEHIERCENNENFEIRDLLWRAYLHIGKIYEQRQELGRSQYFIKRSRELFRLVIDGIDPNYRHSFEQGPQRQTQVLTLEQDMTQLTRTQLKPQDVDELSRVILQESGDYRAFFEINRKLNSVLDLDCLLDLIMDLVVKMSGAKHGYLLTEGQEGLDTLALHNISNEESQASTSVARMVMQNGKPLIASDAMSDARTKSMDTVVNLKLKSILCLPLRLHDEIIGVVYLEDRLRAGAFDAQKVEILEAIADQAAIAIHNARMHAQVLNQEKKIRQLNRKLRAELDEKEKRLKETESLLANQQIQLLAKYKTHNIVARSKRMREVLDLTDRVSQSEVSVVIRGESGTGKELVARAIHYNGPRKGKPFLSINCSALTDNLLESELFGHEKGAFTGASRLKRGLFEAADGGTLFLDEVGDMSASMQTKLLRVLQEGEIRRIGSNSVIKIDVRIIAATHVDLEKRLRTNEFREDLYYRLNTVQITLPPLRKRKNDIELLVRHFIAASDKPTVKITAEAMRALKQHRWPGNIRELENEINRALIFTESIIDLPQLSPRFGQQRPMQHLLGENLGDLVKNKSLESIMNQLEKEVLASALTVYHGKKGETAKQLGVTRYTLYRKLKYHELTSETGDDQGKQ